MKYAFMSFSTPQLSLGDMLKMAKELGYVGIEPRAEAKHAHGIELTATAEDRKSAAKQAADSGVAICCIATSCRFTDPATVQKHIDDAMKYVDLAADVGCPTLRVFGGDFPNYLSRNGAIEVMAEALQKIGVHAAPKGVKVCLETHDAWTHPDHVSKVMKLADHPAVKVNFDLWHPLRSSGMPYEKALEQLKPWIAHTHFHDGGLRLDKLDQRTIGTGELDLGLFLRLLKSINYNGYVSGEWINWEPAEIHLPREIAAMKALEKQLG